MPCKYEFIKFIPSAKTAVVKFSKEGFEPATKRIRVDGFDLEQLKQSAERYIALVEDEWANAELTVDDSLIGVEFEQVIAKPEPEPVPEPVRFIFIDDQFKVLGEVYSVEKPTEYLEGAVDCVADETSVFSVGSKFRSSKVPRDGLAMLELRNLVATRGQIDFALRALGLDIDSYRTQVKLSNNIVLSSFINSNYAQRYEATCPEISLVCDMLKITPSRRKEIFSLAASIDLTAPFDKLNDAELANLTAFIDKNKIKTKKQQAIASAVVTVNGNVYQADENSVARILAKINSCAIAGVDSVDWKMIDNSVVTVSISDLRTALVKATENIENIVIG